MGKFHKEKAEVMKNYLCDIAMFQGYYLDGCIPTKQINAAIRSFAPGLNISTILGFYDTTVLLHHREVEADAVRCRRQCAAGSEACGEGSIPCEGKDTGSEYQKRTGNGYCKDWNIFRCRCFHDCGGEIWSGIQRRLGKAQERSRMD